MVSGLCDRVRVRVRHWPGCSASALLPSGPVTSFFYQNPWIEMTHRTSAILAGPAALAAAWATVFTRTARGAANGHLLLPPAAAAASPSAG